MHAVVRHAVQNFVRQVPVQQQVSSHDLDMVQELQGVLSAQVLLDALGSLPLQGMHSRQAVSHDTRLPGYSQRCRVNAPGCCEYEGS